MAQVKGTVIEAILTFALSKGVKSDWTNELPHDSKIIFNNTVLATEWYPIEDACIIPTRVLAKILNEDENELAWEAGRYSAEKSLTGIYKVFISICSPLFLIKRAGVMITSFYRNVNAEILESSSSHMLVRFYDFSFESEIIEKRIGGWMQVALEKTKCKNVTFDFVNSVTRGDECTKLLIKWN